MQQKSSRWEKTDPEKHHWWDVCVWSRSVGPILPHTCPCGPDLLQICVLSEPFLTASQEDGFSLGQLTWTVQLPPAPARDRNIQIRQFSEVQLLGSGPGQCWGPGQETGKPRDCVIPSEAEQGHKIHE